VNDVAKTTFGTLTPEGKVTNITRIDISKVKSPDPLAYAYGFAQGQTGQSLADSDDLAPEYIRGWKEGRAKSKAKGGKVRVTAQGITTGKDMEKVEEKAHGLGGALMHLNPAIWEFPSSEAATKFADYARNHARFVTKVSR
jgi:hypothetical protein